WLLLMQSYFPSSARFISLTQPPCESPVGVFVEIRPCHRERWWTQPISRLRHAIVRSEGLQVHRIAAIVQQMEATAPLSAAWRTDPGLVRGHNEDFVTVYEPDTPDDRLRHGSLYIVADGVGGA